jgi:hypothetical protein
MANIQELGILEYWKNWINGMVDFAILSEA